MARTPRLTPRFVAKRRALGITAQSPASLAISSTISLLCRADALPTADDKTLLLDPEPGDGRGVSALVHARRVRGQSLWICYRDPGNEVELVALLSTLP